MEVAIKKNRYLQLGAKTCCSTIKSKKKLTTVFSYVSKEEFSLIQMNSFFFFAFNPLQNSLA